MQDLTGCPTAGGDVSTWEQLWEPRHTEGEQNTQEDSDHAQRSTANQCLSARISNWFPVSTSSMGHAIFAGFLWAWILLK